MKNALLQVWGLFVFPNFRCSSKCFAQIYRAQYGATILVELSAPPTWRPKNSVNIWNFDEYLWDNTHTLNLENCLLYLSSIISQFLDFNHWMVFDFFIAWQCMHSIHMWSSEWMQTRGTEVCKFVNFQG